MQANVFPLDSCKRTKHRKKPDASGLKFPYNMIIVNLAVTILLKEKKARSHHQYNGQEIMDQLNTKT